MISIVRIHVSLSNNPSSCAVCICCVPCAHRTKMNHELINQPSLVNQPLATFLFPGDRKKKESLQPWSSHDMKQLHEEWGVSCVNQIKLRGVHNEPHFFPYSPSNKQKHGTERNFCRICENKLKKYMESFAFTKIVNFLCFPCFDWSDVPKSES